MTQPRIDEETLPETWLRPTVARGGWRVDNSGIRIAMAWEDPEASMSRTSLQPLAVPLAARRELLGFLVAGLVVLVALPLALWESYQARRRLRSYGPPAVLALRGNLRARQS